ncbi:MFS transporter [Massilia arenosa]|uniref:MFS transporter n=1 Tax=Zemynaea arenosa TaxID=2561931 RepID=A0A4Y9SGT6_9BURK|nr:MFS transporter [Massilia arenosa]TFW20828.1 MFS transporter [Massilia arenosa]
MATLQHAESANSSDFRSSPCSSGARNVNSRGGDGLVHPGEIAVGVVIGRASEYFDFFVYAIASVVVFPQLLFPFEQPLEAQLWSFAIFSLSFIARPFGTIIFMYLQQKVSREAKLLVALMVLGSATAGLAFLPSYQSAGGLAIGILAVARVAQGIAQGGSWDGLPSLLALNAPKEKRGFYAMLGQLGAPTGFIIAAGVFAYMMLALTEKDFLDWGWRYPFYVAFAINVVALFARLRLVSTPEYSHLLDERELEPTNTVELIRNQGSNIVIGALAALASYALFHLVTVFPLSWIHLYSTERAVVNVLETQIVGAFLCIAAIIGSGFIADRLGRRTTLGLLATGIAVFSGFVPLLISGGELGQNVFILVGFVLLGFSYGQAAGAVTANFESRFRYTGAALTSDLAWLVGAAFAPVVALGLAANFGLAFVSVYLLSGAGGSLAALSLNRVLEIRD